MSGTDSIEKRIIDRLRSGGKCLSTAESCTGGLIAHRITNVPGSSEVYQGGIIAYQNKVKSDMLGVDLSDLAKHGAVSKPVALSMAAGIGSRMKTDYGVAVTGIAGPGGGSPEKPVGLVYIAVAGDEQPALCRRFEFKAAPDCPVPRENIKSQTAEAALTLLLEYLS
jgi:PncC family amidohydrolase